MLGAINVFVYLFYALIYIIVGKYSVKLKKKKLITLLNCLI